MTTTAPSRDDTQIRRRLDEWIAALHAKNVDALMALYAQDTVAFDLMPPQQVRGADRYRKNFEGWFAAMPGPIRYEIQDLRVVAGGDVAFCHGVSHIQGTQAHGAEIGYWVRVTVGLQKRDGQWLVIHDHVSMPCDMQSMKAVPDLRR